MKKKINKVAILSVADLRHMTCASLYYDFFEKNNLSFDVICTDRYNEKVNLDYKCSIYRFPWTLSTKVNKVKKIRLFIRFYLWAKKVIKSKKYDFIIVWNENTALLFGHFLQNKYKNRYAVNVRDVISDLGIFEKTTYKILEKAVFTTITSPKAMGILPPHNRYLMINKDMNIMRRVEKKEKFCFVLPITIIYMGLIYPYLDRFKEVIKVFANDNRYKLCFYGQGADIDLKEFAKKEKIYNVEFGGPFSPEKTSMYLEKADIINSYYPEMNSGLEIAIGVKESYGPHLRIPTISNKGCYWGNLSEFYGFGITVDDLKAFPDKLYDWYFNMDFKTFDLGCERYCQFVEESNKQWMEKLENIFCENE